MTGTVNVGNSATNKLTMSGTTYETGAGAADYEAKSGSTILLTAANPTVTTAAGDLSFSTGDLAVSYTHLTLPTMRTV